MKVERSGIHNSVVGASQSWVHDQILFKPGFLVASFTTT